MNTGKIVVKWVKRLALAVLFTGCMVLLNIQEAASATATATAHIQMVLHREEGVDAYFNLDDVGGYQYGNDKWPNHSVLLPTVDGEAGQKYYNEYGNETDASNEDCVWMFEKNEDVYTMTPQRDNYEITPFFHYDGIEILLGNFVLDLKGKTMTVNADREAIHLTGSIDGTASASFKIMNGTLNIVGTDNGTTSGNTGMITLGNGCVLTIEDAIVNITNKNPADEIVMLSGTNSETAIIIKDSNVKLQNLDIAQGRDFVRNVNIYMNGILITSEEMNAHKNDTKPWTIQQSEDAVVKQVKFQNPDQAYITVTADPQEPDVHSTTNNVQFAWNTNVLGELSFRPNDGLNAENEIHVVNISANGALPIQPDIDGNYHITANDGVSEVYIMAVPVPKITCTWDSGALIKYGEQFGDIIADAGNPELTTLVMPWNYQTAFDFKIATLSGNRLESVSINNLPAIADENGKYSITAEQMEQDASIMVSTSAIKNSVTFNTGNFTVMTGNDFDVVLSDTTVSQLNYDESYSFKVVPTEGYFVNSVKIGNAVLEEEDGVYTISKEQMNENPTVDIESILGVSTANSINFHNGHYSVLYGDGYQQRLTAPGDLSDLMENRKFTFKLNPDYGYEIKTVSVSCNAISNNSIAGSVISETNGVYTIPADVMNADPIVDVIAEEAKAYNVTFKNSALAEVSYLMESSNGETISANKATKEFVVEKAKSGFKFQIDPKQDMTISEVILSQSSPAVKTALTADADGFYVIDTLSSKATVTIVCKKWATGISGIKSELTQTTNTQKTYQLTVKGVDSKGAFSPVDDLAAEVDGDGSAEIIPGKTSNTCGLKITTPYAYGSDQTMTVHIVTLIPNGERELASITVKCVDPQAKKPTMTISEITDTKATLSITDQAKFNVADGQVCYHISAKDKEGNPIDLVTLNPELADTSVGSDLSNDLYLPAAEGSYKKSATIAFRAIGSESLNSEKVSITANVCIGDGISGNYKLDDTAVAVSKSIELLPSKYESNLKLTRIKDTVYTGQGNVNIARTVFSKGTTYKDIDYDALNVLDENGEVSSSLNACLNYDRVTGTFSVNLTDSIGAGTYTLVVKPQWPERCNSKETRYKFKVVKSMNLKFNNVYGGQNAYYNGKTTTYQVSGLYDLYNNSLTGKVRYEISARNQNSITDANNKYITINANSGKVTIKKGFSVSADATNNEYLVKAIPTDYKKYTNEYDPNSIAKTILTVHEGNAEIPYLTICERDGNQLIPYDVTHLGKKNLYVVASKVLISENGIKRTDANLIRTRDYSLKSSNKSIQLIEKDNYYQIKYDGKVCKNVTLTATTYASAKSIKTKMNFEFQPKQLQYAVYQKDGISAIGENLVGDQTVLANAYSREEFGIKPSVILPDDSIDEEYQKYPMDLKVSYDKGLSGLYQANGYYVFSFSGAKLNQGKAYGSVTFTYKVDGKTKKDTITLKSDIEWIQPDKNLKITQTKCLYADSVIPVEVPFTLPESVSDDGMKVSVYALPGEEKGRDEYMDLLVQLYYFNTSKMVVENHTICPGLQVNRAGSYKYGVALQKNEGSASEPNWVTVTTSTMVVKVDKKQSVTFEPSVLLSTVSCEDEIKVKKATKDTNIEFIGVYSCMVNGKENDFHRYFDSELSPDTLKIKLRPVYEWIDEGKGEDDYDDAIKELGKKKDDLKFYVKYRIDTCDEEKLALFTIKVR